MSPGKFSLCLILLFTLILSIVRTSPITGVHDIESEMRHTPQNHCLRFRKFDMIRRCRSFVRRVRRHR